MAPEPQTLRDCAKLREECQKQVFAHIDDRHEKVMSVLGQINGKLSYEEGRRAATGSNKPVNGKKFPWREVAAVIVIVTAAIATAIVSVRSISAGSKPPPPVVSPDP